MPTYKNLYIDGKAVNLVNGSSLKNIIIDDVVYEPESKGAKYKHLVYLACRVTVSSSGSRPVRYQFHGWYMRITFYSDDETPITSYSQIPDGDYPNVSEPGDLTQYKLNSDNNGYGYLWESTAESTHNPTTIYDVSKDGDNLTMRFGSSGSLQTRTWGSYGSTGWTSGSWQAAMGLPNPNSSTNFINGIQSDTVTEI